MASSNDPSSNGNSRRGPTSTWKAIVVVALITVAAAWLAASLAERWTLSRVSAIAEQRLALYASSVRNAVRRHDYLPTILAREPEVLALLADPGDAALRGRVNRTLEAVNRAAGSAVLYVVDASGLAVASSNWNVSACSRGGCGAARCGSSARATHCSSAAWPNGPPT